MNKMKAHTPPFWVRNLRTLMQENGYNPRSLSLKAGLNATAVRDMMEGRSRFPRYDTALALATALNTTPSHLMNEGHVANDLNKEPSGFGQDLELLTEILTRLQEVTAELDRKLAPRDVAAMAATIYRRLQDDIDGKKRLTSIRPYIIDLLDFESLRQKRARR